MTPYTLNINKVMFEQIRKIISIIVLVAFLGTSLKTAGYAQVAQMPILPAPGIMVHLSPEFTPAVLKGIVIHPENALKFDFIIYKGDKEFSADQKKDEYTKLIKYFLASLAVPDENQWVNLSPYEKDRIIKDDFGKTEMGRDLLAQDYLLKQITASLIYPQDKIGQRFWGEVYSKAQKQYGTTDVPINTFNKVWIVPDNADIYEKGNVAYLYKSHLKVMLEEDYLSLEKHSGIASAPNKTHTIGSQVVREVVLPELEKEVNEGKNFAPLRQVFSGMILAAWYKRALRESLLSQIYANKDKVKGVDQNPKNNDVIYKQYLKAFKKGVFNFIQEDVDKYTNETIPRKYFSGGATNMAPAVDQNGNIIMEHGLPVLPALHRHLENDRLAAQAATTSAAAAESNTEAVAVQALETGEMQARPTTTNAAMITPMAQVNIVSAYESSGLLDELKGKNGWSNDAQGQIELLKQKSAGVLTMNQFLDMLPLSDFIVNEGYSLGISDVMYEALSKISNLVTWRDFYKKKGWVEEEKVDEHLTEVAALKTPIVFFVPRDIFTHERANVVKSEIRWILSHPEVLKNVMFVFGGDQAVPEDFLKAVVQPAPADQRAGMLGNFLLRNRTSQVLVSAMTDEVESAAEASHLGWYASKEKTLMDVNNPFVGKGPKRVRVKEVLADGQLKMSREELSKFIGAEVSEAKYAAVQRAVAEGKINQDITHNQFSRDYKAVAAAEPDGGTDFLSKNALPNLVLAMYLTDYRANEIKTRDGLLRVLHGLTDGTDKEGVDAVSRLNHVAFQSLVLGQGERAYATDVRARIGEAVRKAARTDFAPFEKLYQEVKELDAYTLLPAAEWLEKRVLSGQEADSEEILRKAMTDEVESAAEASHLGWYASKEKTLMDVNNPFVGKGPKRVRVKEVLADGQLKMSREELSKFIGAEVSEVKYAAVQRAVAEGKINQDITHNQFSRDYKAVAAAEPDGGTDFLSKNALPNLVLAMYLTDYRAKEIKTRDGLLRVLNGLTDGTDKEGIDAVSKLNHVAFQSLVLGQGERAFVTDVRARIGEAVSKAARTDFAPFEKLYQEVKELDAYTLLPAAEWLIGRLQYSKADAAMTHFTNDKEAKKAWDKLSSGEQMAIMQTAYRDDSYVVKMNAYMDGTIFKEYERSSGNQGTDYQDQRPSLTQDEERIATDFDNQGEGLGGIWTPPSWYKLQEQRAWDQAHDYDRAMTSYHQHLLEAVDNARERGQPTEEGYALAALKTYENMNPKDQEWAEEEYNLRSDLSDRRILPSQIEEIVVKAKAQFYDRAMVGRLTDAQKNALRQLLVEHSTEREDPMVREHFFAGNDIDIGGYTIAYIPETEEITIKGKDRSGPRINYRGKIWSHEGEHSWRTAVNEAIDHPDAAMADRASVSKKIADSMKREGGIDFNSANLSLQIKRDGRGVPLPISQQNISNIHIDGLTPVILDIKPAVASPLLAQLQNPAQDMAQI